MNLPRILRRPDAPPPPKVSHVPAFVIIPEASVTLTDPNGNTHVPLNVIVPPGAFISIDLDHVAVEDFVTVWVARSFSVPVPDMAPLVTTVTPPDASMSPFTVNPKLPLPSDSTPPTTNLLVSVIVEAPDSVTALQVMFGQSNVVAKIEMSVAPVVTTVAPVLVIVPVW